MASAILVIGSTGNQGGAVINALLAAPESLDMPILAVTRNTETAGAKALHSKSPSRIKLIKGDLNDCDGIFKAAKVPVKSVFFVPIPAIGPRMKIVIEEIQGKALIDAAVRNAVEHFVFTSVARYGDDSESTETDVPHFITKARIEKHLQEKAGKSMTWTILRPVTFMDNVNTSFAGKVFCTGWKIRLSPTKKMQLVAAQDIGWFGAQALLRPKDYAGRCISLAGDALTFKEANEIFKKKFGRNIPTTYSLVVSSLLLALKPLGSMFKFFENASHAADISSLRKERPELLSFEQWLDISIFAQK